MGVKGAKWGPPVTVVRGRAAAHRLVGGGAPPDALVRRRAAAIAVYTRRAPSGRRRAAPKNIPTANQFPITPSAHQSPLTSVTIEEKNGQ